MKPADCRVFHNGDSFILENSAIRLEVLPKLGGRVWNLWDVRSGRQWIWQNPVLPLRTPLPNIPFDDQWAGGWEQLYPNDAEGEFEGRLLPDHGEWWSKPWTADVAASGPDRAELRLRATMEKLPSTCEKTLWLERDEPRLHVRYRIRNDAHDSVRFLFKEHLAVAVDPQCRLELPGGSVTAVSLEYSRRIGKPGPHRWPTAQDKSGRLVDLSRLPDPAEESREFIYVEKLPEGWCGVRHEPSGARLRMRYSTKDFPYTWMFMDFGGWKGYYLVVLEPCTTMPKDLNEAAKRGSISRLEPGKSLDCDLTVELS